MYIFRFKYRSAFADLLYKCDTNAAAIESIFVGSVPVSLNPTIDNQFSDHFNLMRRVQVALSKATYDIAPSGPNIIGRSFRMKRCPECFVNLPFETAVCPWCNQKTKNRIDKHGYAKRPFNWAAYLSCFISWVVVVLYIWWAFFDR